MTVTAQQPQDPLMPSENTPKPVRQILFFVDEDPYCLIGREIVTDCEKYLSSVDADYFAFHANLLSLAFAEAEQDEEKHRIATAIRSLYLHGLETTMALTFAAIQAPHCAVGWMLKYKPGQLRILAEKINQFKPIYALSSRTVQSWGDIVLAIHEPFCMHENPEREREILEEMRSDWERLGNEMAQQFAADEYNSIKHGLRVLAGGASVSIGRQDSVGIPAWDYLELFNSKYGSQFFVPLRKEVDKRQFSLEHHSSNWDPHALIEAIRQMSLCIGNAIAYIRVMTGSSDGTQLPRYEPDRSILARWESSSGDEFFRIGEIVEGGLPTVTKDEVLTFYESIRDQLRSRLSN